MNWVSSNIRTTGLLTDFYELTMAAGYWKSGMADREAVFHLFFRKHPFQGGYTIAAGLADAVECLRQLRFDESDLAYLASLKSAAGRPLFAPEFLEYLRAFKFRCDVDAIPEGSVVFPHEPLVRVRGPILQAQLIETMLLQIINFQSLIATKAARICQSAAGDPVIEFGLRRSQGADGGLAASRAAYIGGCAGTSNVIAGRELGVPVKGTHAHSWVMAFPSERESFAAFARAMPDNCILLVDTYDSLEGVQQAVAVAKQLRAQGRELAGIRLDSGDLAYLSIAARQILDDAGFPDAVIVGSNDLDEHIITSLKQQGARINVWGVGTRLVTAFDEPALGGVYKLAAIRGDDGEWEAKLKLSEQTAKITTPGMLQVRRFSRTPNSSGMRFMTPGGPCPKHSPSLIHLMRRGGSVFLLAYNARSCWCRCCDRVSSWKPCLRFKPFRNACEHSSPGFIRASSAWSIHTSIPSDWNPACTISRHVWC